MQLGDARRTGARKTETVRSALAFTGSEDGWLRVVAGTRAAPPPLGEEEEFLQLQPQEAEPREIALQVIHVPSTSSTWSFSGGPCPRGSYGRAAGSGQPKRAEGREGPRRRRRGEALEIFKTVVR